MKSPSLAVVIATNRPESLKRWVDEWTPHLDGTDIYVIEDRPDGYTDADFGRDAYQFNWHDIDRELGDKAWVIPRRTSAIKSFGFMKAYAEGYDYIWTLDDDCLPDPGYEHPYVASMKRLIGMSQADDSWYNTIEDTGLYPRGYPYGIRQKSQPVMIHHGLWAGVPDLDGITALEHHALRLKSRYHTERVPTGQMFPMCGMNLVFRAEMAPAMYFGLQGRERSVVHNSIIEGSKPLPFDRFDDIWAGLFAKKVCDHLGYAVTSGGPTILHTKESNPTQRVIKEGPGIAAHEILWPLVANFQLEDDTVKSCYSDLASLVMSVKNELPYPDYWKRLAEAMHTWTEMF